MPQAVEKMKCRVKAGKKGGKNGRGKVKRRSSDQARAAVNARWKRWREKNTRKDQITASKGALC